MTINIRDIAAVSNATDGILGFLLWYTIGEQLVEREELKDKILDAGIDEGFMPPEIRISDAFRRATTAVERKRELATNKNGVVKNYLVREVSSDTHHILRHIVCETKDTKGRRLSYDPKVATMQLNKESCTISCSANDDIAKEMCVEAESLFWVFQTHHDATSIRRMVYWILNAMAPTPVRPSGGVYFVPVKHQNEVRKLINFLKSLNENTEGFSVPVIDTTENRDMVRTKLKDHIKGTLNSLAQALKDPDLSKSKGNPLLTEARNVLENFKDYQAALGEDLEDMQLTVNLIQQQMLTMVEKLTA